MEPLPTDPVRVLRQVTAAPLAAGAKATLTVIVSGTRPGDVVTAGPPAGVPPELLVAGSVAVSDRVRLRLSNSGTAAVDPSGLWALAAGNGLASGGPQMVATDAESFAPYPMASVSRSTP